MEYEEGVGYVEDQEKYGGREIRGKEVRVYARKEEEKYEEVVDEEGMMRSFGDVGGYEKDRYTEEEE